MWLHRCGNRVHLLPRTENKSWNKNTILITSSSVDANSDRIKMSNGAHRQMLGALHCGIVKNVVIEIKPKSANNKSRTPEVCSRLRFGFSSFSCKNLINLFCDSSPMISQNNMAKGGGRSHCLLNFISISSSIRIYHAATAKAADSCRKRKREKKQIAKIFRRLQFQAMTK